MLKVKNLKVSFYQGRSPVNILSEVEFDILSGETLALVGESGCGKTLTALSIVKLLPRHARIDQGEINLLGDNIVNFTEEEMLNIRGKKIGMIFQEPSSYLNPVYSIGNQITEAIRAPLTKKEKKEKVFQALTEVGLKPMHYWQFPHQLSGGMQQRSLIAMALINQPALLIADEPTTSLDVTTAIQIMTLIQSLQEKHRLALLLITHDIALACHFSDWLAVMYTGRIVEIGPAKKIFSSPLHPYTENLIACLPEKYQPKQTISAIPGSVPDFRRLPSGCSYHPRCKYRLPVCACSQPPVFRKDDIRVRCFRYGKTLGTEKS